MKLINIKKSDNLIAFLLLFIPITFWLIFSAYPLVYGIILSFIESKGFGAEMKFVGFANFKMFFTLKYYYQALINTLCIGGLCFIFGVILSLLVATVLNKIMFLKGLYRAAWYIPVITSSVAVAQIFNILLDPYTGVINNILLKFDKEPIIWDMSTGWGVFWIVVYSTWKGLGGSVLMWLAAFQSVDHTLSEAASLDGANKVVAFWKIIFPQMKPMVIYILVTGFVGALQIYEQVLFITNGGPYNSTNVLAVIIMKDAFIDNNYGMAGVSSVISLLITFGFTIFLFKKVKVEF